MPLEIKELYIKVTVNEEEGDEGKSQSAEGGSAASPEAIVQTCVEQVLQILKDREER